jgi:hypothetical protein
MLKMFRDGGKAIKTKRSITHPPKRTMPRESGKGTFGGKQANNRYVVAAIVIQICF